MNLALHVDLSNYHLKSMHILVWKICCAGWKTRSLTKSKIFWFESMDFLYFFTDCKQDHINLQPARKIDLLVCSTFETVSDFSMHNVYWDTLYFITNAFVLSFFPFFSQKSMHMYLKPLVKQDIISVSIVEMLFIYYLKLVI